MTGCPLFRIQDEGGVNDSLHRSSSVPEIDSLLGSTLEVIFIFSFISFNIFYEWVCIIIARKHTTNKMVTSFPWYQLQVQQSTSLTTSAPTGSACTWKTENQSHAFACCTSSTESFSTQPPGWPLLIYQSCERKPFLPSRTRWWFILPSRSIFYE